MPSQAPLSVHLVRHGETEWNRDGRCQGVTDIPLTPKGLSQAEAVAATFAAKRPGLILSSPLQRALETARRLPSRTAWAVKPSRRCGSGTRANSRA